MKERDDFTTGRILVPLLRFAVPVLFALFLQATYGAVDLLIVGQFASSADVSAVSTGSQIMQTFTGLVSSFAVGILKNFNKGYMDSVAAKIEQYSIVYRELYTDCYNMLLELEDKSIDNIVLGGFGKISKAAGEAIAKVPVISKSELDENLIAIGDIIEISDEAIRKAKLSTLVSKQSSYVAPFVENIKMIGELHDKPINLLFDKENLYFETVVA